MSEIINDNDLEVISNFENKNENKTISYFSCRECEGPLRIELNPETFLLNAKCELNKEHNFQNIFLKTFQQYYIKYQKIPKCIKCHVNLENNNLYLCKKSSHLFCMNCLLKEKKTNKFNFNLFDQKKCSLHRNNYMSYCCTCKKNICLYCINENLHDNHKIKDYINIIPTKDCIKNAKIKLDERIKYTNHTIDNIIAWTSKFIDKIEWLLQTLKNESKFLEEVYNRYDYKNMSNISYHENMKYIIKYIEKGYNSNLKEFNKTNNFSEKSTLMLKVLKNLGNKNYFKEEIDNKRILINFGSNNTIDDYNGLIEKINDKYFISMKINSIKLFYIGNNNKIHCWGKFNFLFRAYSITVCHRKNKIFVSLKNQKKIQIINYNLENKTMTLSDEVISDHLGAGSYYKCIILPNDYIVASDNTNINIFYYNSEFHNYTLIDRIKLETITSDLLLMNENYFIACQPDMKMLTIFDNNNLSLIKEINNIDCVDYLHCLFNYKNENILINCKNGIGLLSIPLQEIVQYIEIGNNNWEKQMSLNNRGDIFVILEDNENNNKNEKKNRNNSNGNLDNGENEKNIIIKIFKINKSSIEYCSMIKNIENINKLIYPEIRCYNDEIIILTSRGSIMKSWVKDVRENSERENFSPEITRQMLDLLKGQEIRALRNENNNINII